MRKNATMPLSPVLGPVLGDSSGGPLSLSAKDIAGLTGLCERTIAEMIRRRQIPARRVGRRVIVLADDLAAYLRDLPMV